MAELEGGLQLKGDCCNTAYASSASRVLVKT